MDTKHHAVYPKNHQIILSWNDATKKNCPVVLYLDNEIYIIECEKQVDVSPELLGIIQKSPHVQITRVESR